ncbi:hypothetical protein ACKGJY_00460 [Hyunsoonleella sp. 2307UL5-6]|uniref:hypothetical protein n=1 Tax=Hyunsoonleella sp. 2307UL5-6 TaxID=3384768 RepID=UPI0039BD0560
MKKIILGFVLILFSFSCESTDGVSDGEYSIDLDTREIGDVSVPDPGNGNGNNTPAGKITAGEWNDLSNWEFWNTLINSQDYNKYKNSWSFNTAQRIAVKVLKTNQNPFNNARVSLYKNDELLTETKTDNLGEANFFINMFDSSGESTKLIEYSININGIAQETVLSFGESVHTFILNKKDDAIENKIELAFMVDATGSMSDELEFLKNDLTDVINKVKNSNEGSTINTAAVFYRDHGDAYVTKRSDFSASIKTTSQFIKQQFANGGGDYPEAVDEALLETVNDLQWSNTSKTRIAFLLLDAPPHDNIQVSANLENAIKASIKKGIKLIPIVASGIDKNTEFLMRYFAIATNGTYVFITDDSGIGNDHLEPTIGAYKVEFLNDLLVRLINKYAK